MPICLPVRCPTTRFRLAALFAWCVIPAQRPQPGEILVAEFTDPGWTPLFIRAGRSALKVGGALTRGAVVAREYGIPAVVGVRNATRRLWTGQRVRVDGNRGVVEILSEG